MKNNTHSGNSQRSQQSNIPDFDIIDLEKDYTLEFSQEQETGLQDAEEETDFYEYGEPEEEAPDVPRRPAFRFYIHILLLALFLLLIGGVIYRFFNWGNRVNLDEIFQLVEGTYDNSSDNFLPLLDAEGMEVYKYYGEGSTILVFGNAPFADDRDSQNNLANMIQEMTGATVYNCSVSGSYLAAQWPSLNVEEQPLDIFTFYWLSTLTCNDHIDQKYLDGLEILGDSAPPEAMYVYNTLKSIDMDTVDVIAVMYDASDYLAGHKMYSDESSTDIEQFTGNLEAGIEVLQEYHPNVRIIVMSPTYAYGLDPEGNYVSSDIQRYGWDVLSTYVIKECESCYSRSVSFVDHLYGTITSDNADEYLIDHLHLNVEGRRLVAQRFVNALTRYNQDEE